MIWRHYKTSFEAAHHIEGHDRCGVTHGHSYRVLVSVVHPAEFYDFHELRTLVDTILEDFDHKDLGSMTCEQITESIKTTLLNQETFDMIRVEVWETHEFGCSTEWPQVIDIKRISTPKSCEIKRHSGGETEI